MTHILLQEGDIIKEGDECLDENRVWVKARSLGTQTDGWSIHRRPLPTKPKVSLEELTNIAIEVYHKQILIGSHQQSLKSSISSICAHLGIELELEKEEWERAFEQLLGDAGKDKDIPHIKAWCKAMFEAGQRSKEK